MAHSNQLVLVGGGQAHLYSLKQTHRLVKKGAQVTLVSPGRYHYYSGMGAGMLSRFYKPDQLRFDLKALVESGGGTFIQDRVVTVDPYLRTLELDQRGQSLAYDLASFNVGSQVALDNTGSDECASFAAKPIENLVQARKAILDLKVNDVARSTGAARNNGAAHITIVGGGPAGIELAANIAELIRDKRPRAQVQRAQAQRARTPRVRITLVNSADRLLPGFPAQAAHLAEHALTQRGVEIVHRFHVTQLAPGQLQSTAGASLACDIAVIATGIVPPKLFTRSELATTPDGALVVNDCLQHPDHLEIFGGGDCIAIEGKPLERLGIHAARQGPVLYHNLLATLEEKALRAFVPSRNDSLILNMGDGTGILIWRSMAWQGRLAFALKHLGDIRFVSRFQQ